MNGFLCIFQGLLVFILFHVGSTPVAIEHMVVRAECNSLSVVINSRVKVTGLQSRIALLLQFLYLEIQWGKQVMRGNYSPPPPMLFTYATVVALSKSMPPFDLIAQ